MFYWKFSSRGHEPEPFWTTATEVKTIKSKRDKLFSAKSRQWFITEVLLNNWDH